MKKAFLILFVLCVSLLSIQAQDAYITVTPSSLSSVKAAVGDTVAFRTVHISQGNVSGSTYLYLTGYNSSMFSLSADEIPEDVNEMDLVITYHPTAPGKHTALLNIDNYNHTGLFQSISLKGECEDVSLHPSISVTPTELAGFEAVVGGEMDSVFTVTSAECKDYVYLRVDHIQGTAFTIDNTMLMKNTTSDVTVRFKPREVGSYMSRVTIYTLDADSVYVILKGTAREITEDDIDWQARFVWGEAKPLTYLNETFDSVAHNKTLLLEGWQNVAAKNARPWWGYRDGCAKATSYQYGVASTGLWDMWLVTPALDYKKTETKQFGFKVMGEYLPLDSARTWLEVYYVDPSIMVDDAAYFQNISEYFEIPFLEEQSGEWYKCVLDMTPFASTVADVFYMAFRYMGPNGANGVVTYYIDDVTWGFDPTVNGAENVTQNAKVRKELRDGQIIVVRGEKEFDVVGRQIK